MMRSADFCADNPKESRTEKIPKMYFMILFFFKHFTPAQIADELKFFFRQ